MTDRELLELAAKAAGYDTSHRWNAERMSLKPPVIGLCIPNVGTLWNPLEDSGAALDLAVKLNLDIRHNPGTEQQLYVAASRSGCEGCYAPVSCFEDEFEESERPAATRRAIVRAAAAIALVTDQKQLEGNELC